MDEPVPDEYPDVVASLPFGKRLPDALYVHASAVPQLPKECWPLVERAQSLVGLAEDRFNVIKFHRSTPTISLLAYPRFFEDGFPVLSHSWTVHLAEANHSERSYAADENPPILHRKELLLPPDHPAAPDFAALTRRVGEYGLLENPSEIGFLLPWQARLDRLRLQIRGNEVFEFGDESEADGAKIQRERTALSRYALSSPVQALWRNGYLDGERNLFDYGCGRGDDVRILGALGVEAAGWDPHFRPEADRREAELVNLGFVLNVIEDRKERADALLGAWHLTKTLLVVAALVGNRSEYEKHRLYRDGVLTSRGTFQKYFSQSELRDYIGSVLDHSPLAVGPGVYFVFRRDEDEQRFLEARYGGRPPPTRSLPYDPSALGPRPRRTSRRPSKWDENAELVEEYWKTCLTLGRMAEIDEFPRSTELCETFRSCKSVFGRLMKERGSAELDAARTSRRDDLSVFFALEIFERRGRLRDLSPRIQRDVRSLWGSHSNALADGKRTLFESGAREHLAADAEHAIATGLGALDERGHLNVHQSVLRQLPKRLRVFVGCAERIYGDVSEYDLLRLHLWTKKLSLLSFEGFDDRPIPRIRRRVKIFLARADFIEFDYPPDRDAPVLYWKSDYLKEDSPAYERQRPFDQQLRAFRWHETEGWPYTDAQLRATLDQRGLRIRGHQIVQTRQLSDLGPPAGLIDPLASDKPPSNRGQRARAGVDSSALAHRRRPREETDQTMTIIQAVAQVLEGSSKPLSAKEIHDEIVAKGLFTFGAKDPVSMVRSTIQKHLRKDSERASGITQLGRDQFGWQRA